MVTKELEKRALNLNPLDKIHLVEKILESLDQPNPEIEEIWVKEAEERYAAFRRGEIKAIPYETVKKRLKIK